MKRTKQLLLIVAFSLLCSTTYAQEFVRFTPDVLGIDSDAETFGEAFTREFDISENLGLAQDSVIVEFQNAFLNQSGASFTVSSSEATTISISADDASISERLRGQVSHGSNLGTVGGRDGIRFDNDESFSFVSDLDSGSGFVEGSAVIDGVNELFIESQVADASNSEGFVFESDGAFSEVTVFTTNTPSFNNNFSFSVQLTPAAAIPEPASGLMLTCVVGSFLMRRKRS